MPKKQGTTERGLENGRAQLQLNSKEQKIMENGNRSSE